MFEKRKPEHQLGIREAAARLRETAQGRDRPLVKAARARVAAGDARTGQAGPQGPRGDSRQRASIPAQSPQTLCSRSANTIEKSNLDFINFIDLINHKLFAN